MLAGGHGFGEAGDLFGGQVAALGLGSSGEFGAAGGVAADEAIVDGLSQDGGEVVDVASGEVVDEVAYDGSVVDQSIDPSGAYLIIAYADGRVVWRSVDGEAGTLADGGHVSADW